MTYSNSEIIEAILFREIQKEINNEYIKKIKTPSHIMNVSPVTYSYMTDEEIKEFKEKFQEYWNEVVNRDIK